MYIFIYLYFIFYICTCERREQYQSIHEFSVSPSYYFLR